MNLQLRKELVGLRWAGAIALLMALVPMLGRPEGGGVGILGLWIWLFFLGCVVLGMEVMGQEFSGRTIGLLLTQPSARAVLWRWKMAALGLGLGVMSLLFVILSAMGMEQIRALGGWTAAQVPSFGGWLAACGAVLLAGVGSALWLSMVVRQSAPVFWLALLLPTSLFGLVGMVAERMAGRSTWHTPGMVVVAGLGGLGWWMAYRWFLRAEEVSTLSREFHLGWTRRRTPGSESAGWALWRKELRLHQLPALVTLLGAGILLAVLAMHWLAPSETGGLVSLVVLCLWFLVPFFVGAGAVAEERRLGTAAGWRMLPVSWSRQWWTKVAAAMAVALVLGAIVPLLLNLAGWWVMRAEVRDVPVVPWWGWCLSWALGSTLGLYASSLTRSLVQALTVGVAVVGVGAGLLTLAWAERGDPRVVKLGLAFGAGLFLPTLWWLARNNAVAAIVDRRLIRRNASLVLGMLLGIGLLSSAVYNRAWDLVLPEPSPGPPLPVVAGVQPKIQMQWPANAVALTTDGRLWLCRFADAAALFQIEPEVTLLGEGRVFQSIGVTHMQLYAVDSGGALWVWNRPSTPSAAAPALQPHRVGMVGEWKSVDANHDHGVALKRDGSLWGFGRSQNGQLGVISTHYRHDPVQLGARRVWRYVATSYSATLALDDEGRVWRWGRLPRTLPEQIVETEVREPQLVAESNDWVRLHGRLGLQWGAGEKADGSVWVFDLIPLSGGETWQVQPPERLEKPIVNLMWTGPWFLAGCTDGTLWRWAQDQVYSHDASDLVVALNSVTPRRASRRTDWVAFSPQGLGLTADGVLWGWPEDRSRWLGPPRRMQQLITLPKDAGK